MAEVIGALKISLGLDSIDFTKGMSNVDKRINALNTEFKAISAGSAKFDNSLEALGKRSDVLTRTFQTHQAKVQELKRQYDESKRASGENSAETLRLASAYNRAYAAMQKTEDQLNYVNKKMNDTSSELSNQSNLWQNVSRKIDETGDTLKNTGQKMSQAGQNLTASLTLPIVGFATAAGKAALDFDKASGQIQAELGLSESKAKELNDTAKELWEDGFGDSIGSVSSKIAGVTRSLGDLGKVDLYYVTKGLDLFEQRGWADQQESLRAIKVLMEQFGMSASEAMDYLTKGFQENLNFSGEFLDTISEYSTYFNEFGFDADQMFAKLKSGAESGAFQLDKVGDAMKEFSLRAKDGSKTSEESFKALGLNANKMTKEFNAGGDTAKKAFETVVKALKNTEDETVRNTASVGLFGTQFEDLGEKAFDAMLEAGKGLKDVEGATKKASDALRDNFGTRATKIWRNFVEDMEPVGEILLDVAEDILPKVAETVGDVTEAFEDLSPEGKNTALAIGGIAATAGPTLITLGALTSGLGSVSKMVSPLIPMLGSGAGFTGVLSKIPGPVGLVATGLGLATVATIAIKDATEKSKEVNLEHVKSLNDQQAALDQLSGKYQDLREKNKLSNDELLRFKDIQSELKLAKSAGEIKALKDEAEKLKKESGLTNKEFEEMLGLNDEIINKTPEVKQSFSDRGNSIISNKDAITEVNNGLRESIKLELENQRIKAEANLEDNIRGYIEALDEQKEKQKELDELVRNTQEVEVEIAELKLKAQEQYNDGQVVQSKWTEANIASLETSLGIHNETVSTLVDEVEKKREAKDEIHKQISATQELLGEMINIQLAQVGINEKGDKGIAQLEQSLQKSVERKAELLRISDAQNGLNEQQQEELNKLDSAISKYGTAKNEIKNMQSEQQSVNQRIEEGTGKAKGLNNELSKNVTKNVKVDDNGGANNLQRNVEKDAHKDVDVDDNGDNARIQKASEKKAYKGIKLSLINTVSSLLPPAISMPIKFIGGKLNIPGFATGTRNAPGGLSLVGEEGPELIHLPQGAKVIPNPQSEAILKNWNIPMLATGGVTLSPGMALVGEGGRELLDMRGARTAPLVNSFETKERPIEITIKPSAVIMDGREVSRVTWRYDKEYQEREESNLNMFGGG